MRTRLHTSLPHTARALHAGTMRPPAPAPSGSSGTWVAWPSPAPTRFPATCFCENTTPPASEAPAPAQIPRCCGFPMAAARLRPLLLVLALACTTGKRGVDGPERARPLEAGRAGRRVLALAGALASRGRPCDRTCGACQTVGAALQRLPEAGAAGPGPSPAPHPPRCLGSGVCSHASTLRPLAVSSCVPRREGWSRGGPLRPPASRRDHLPCRGDE